MGFGCGFAGAVVSGEVAFAAEISQDRKHCAVVAAGREMDGTRVVVDLVWYDHPRGVVARLTGLWEKHDPVAVVVDPRSQAGTLLLPLAEAGILVTEPGTADVSTAHGTFLDLVSDGGLVHLDQGPLTSAVRAAQQRPLSGAQAWERRVEIDQSPLVAATFAVWGFTNWERLAAPNAWIVLGEVRRGPGWDGWGGWGWAWAGAGCGGMVSSVFDLPADDGGRDPGAAFQLGQPRFGGLLPLFLGT